MLKNNLFTISSIEQENEIYKAQIEIDPAHEIFQGHFPGQPILPGVCLIEMVKEVLKEIGQKSYKLVSAATIKYLHVVDPGKDQILTFEFGITEEAGVKRVNVTSFLPDGTSNFKFKGTFA
jgi:3-hydroxyacyl-[acyl-carrier-protein] dehydratase